MAGNEISASGVEGWKERGVGSEVGSGRAQRQVSHIMCHSNL